MCDNIISILHHWVLLLIPASPNCKSMLKLSILFLFIFSVNADGQVTSFDSSLNSGGIDKAVQSYHQSLGIGEAIYNGRRHIDYLPANVGIPYYLTKEWQQGNVSYDNILYNALVKYDEVADEILVRHPEGFAIVLFSPRVSEFSFPGHHFLYINNDNHVGLAAGFYEQLQKGRLTILVKRSKVVLETVAGTAVERKFDESNTYYAIKDGKTYTVKKMNNVMELVADQKKEIQQYLKKNKVKFRKNKELALTRIAEYYNNH